MQSGTAAILQSGNLFAYCINNPVMFVDPSGLFIARAMAMAAGAVMTTVAGAIVSSVVSSISSSANNCSGVTRYSGSGSSRMKNPTDGLNIGGNPAITTSTAGGVLKSRTTLKYNQS